MKRRLETDAQTESLKRGISIISKNLRKEISNSSCLIKFIVVPDYLVLIASRKTVKKSRYNRFAGERNGIS